MKTNRNSLIRNTIALILGFMWLSVSPQAVVGIFLTVKDFQNGKLSFIKTDSSDCKIRIRSASPNKRIKLICGKEISYLKKDSVYGYKNKDGVTYRFYKGSNYALVNLDEEIQLYKALSSIPTKYEPAHFSYFFSRDASSPIYPLTIDNILRAFSDNNRFSDLVELRYRHDSELMEFDGYHKKYKLNCILEISKN